MPSKRRWIASGSQFVVLDTSHLVTGETGTDIQLTREKQRWLEQGSKKRGPQWDSAALKEELNKCAHFSHVQRGLCRREPRESPWRMFCAGGDAISSQHCRKQNMRGVAQVVEESLTPQSTWRERTGLQRVSAEPSMVSHRKEHQAFVTSHTQRPQTPDCNCTSLGRPLLTLPLLPLSSRSPSQQPSKEHDQLVDKEEEKKLTSIPIPSVYKL